MLIDRCQVLLTGELSRFPRVFKSNTAPVSSRQLIYNCQNAMNKNYLTHPALWTVFGGIAIGAIGFSQFTRTAPISAPPLAVALPVRSPEAPKLDVPMSLKAFDDSIANLAEFALPSVVYIEVSNPARSSQRQSVMGSGEGEAGAGSGVIIRPDGYILTNDHVVGGFDKVKVTLNDGRSFDGEVRRAKESDLAIVKINASALPSRTARPATPSLLALPANWFR